MCCVCYWCIFSWTEPFLLLFIVTSQIYRLLVLGGHYFKSMDNQVRWIIHARSAHTLLLPSATIYQEEEGGGEGGGKARVIRDATSPVGSCSSCVSELNNSQEGFSAKVTSTQWPIIANNCAGHDAGERMERMERGWMLMPLEYHADCSPLVTPACPTYASKIKNWPPLRLSVCWSQLSLWWHGFPRSIILRSSNWLTRTSMEAKPPTEM